MFVVVMMASPCNRLDRLDRAKSRDLLAVAQRQQSAEHNTHCFLEGTARCVSMGLSFVAWLDGNAMAMRDGSAFKYEPPPSVVVLSSCSS